MHKSNYGPSRPGLAIHWCCFHGSHTDLQLCWHSGRKRSPAVLAAQVPGVEQASATSDDASRGLGVYGRWADLEGLRLRRRLRRSTTGCRAHGCATTPAIFRFGTKFERISKLLSSLVLLEMLTHFDLVVVLLIELLHGFHDVMPL